MKKIVLFMTLLSAAAQTIPVANAADGTVNFNGMIADEACSVDIKSASQVITMGTISTSAFKSAGEVASPTRFSIALNNCPESVKNISVNFTGTADAVNTNLLGLSSDSGAKNVGVALYESDSMTLIPLRADSALVPIESTSSVNTLNYVAKYMATASTVMPGSANATADFTLGYN